MAKTLRQIRKLLKEETQDTLVVGHLQKNDVLLKPFFEMLKKNLTGMKVTKFGNYEYVEYHFVGNGPDVRRLKQALKELKMIDLYLKSEAPKTGIVGSPKDEKSF